MAGQRQQACGGLFGLACRAKYEGEQRRSERVEHGGSSQLVAGGLHAHQRHETGQLVRSGLDAFVIAVLGPYHQIGGEIVANQAIMGRCDAKPPAQQGSDARPGHCSR